MLKEKKELNLRQIKKGLEKLFSEGDEYYIVFWYDEKQDFTKEFERLELDNLEKIELNNNEFTIKHNIFKKHKENPELKFLIYSKSAKPSNEKNWLLDLLLSNKEFVADKSSIHLADLALDLRFREFVKDHLNFFDEPDFKKQISKFITAKSNSLSSHDLKMKMLNIVLGSSAEADDFDAALTRLIIKFWETEQSSIDSVKEYKLYKVLSDELKAKFNYEYVSELEVSLEKNLTLKLFDYAFKEALNIKHELKFKNEAKTFLNAFKNNILSSKTFKKIADIVSEDLKIEDLLNRDELSVESLLEADTFSLIEKKIISELKYQIINNQINEKDLNKIIEKRNRSVWLDEFKNIYLLLETVNKLLFKLNTYKAISSLEKQKFIDHYLEQDYIIDQLYRKLSYYKDTSGQNTLVKDLIDEIDAKYSKFLSELNMRWQEVVDSMDSWTFNEAKMQRNFFKYNLKEDLKKRNKYIVIISDALRYEVGKELAESFDSKKFKVHMDYMISSLPSYTQLGMASLLPEADMKVDQKNLEKSEKNEFLILKDGKSTKGTAPRSRRIQDALLTYDKNAIAISYEDIKEKNREELRDLIKENDLIFIYHNTIDDQGDRRKTEAETSIAAYQAIEDIKGLVEKFSNNNGNNFFITADHGFLYQNDVEDYFIDKHKIEESLYENRRFIVSKSDKNYRGFKKFSSAELGLACDFSFYFPRSISRIRIKGSGFRFVHGGTSLQEILIPNIKINNQKVSKGDTEVNVELIIGSNNIISSNQHTFRIYQNRAVTSTLKGIKVLAGLYSETDELISDTQSLNLDSKSENTLDREYKVTLSLNSKANKFDKQNVYLRVLKFNPSLGDYNEDLIKHSCKLRKSFTADFD